MSDAPHHDAERSFWDEDTVPEDNDNTLGKWIGRDISQDDPSWNIFVPGETQCGMWHSSPNKERHASFGDNGITASTTCYGDLIQMSRFLDAGSSRMFTIDQCSVTEPYYVDTRARDLVSHSTDPGGDFSFGLEIPWFLSPDQDKPPEVKWVHWRWPRYEYDTRLPDVKACWQYMVHEGIVLQQLTVENTGNDDVNIEDFGFRSRMQIRDLDFLDGWYRFNFSDQGLHSPGPFDFGYVTVKILQQSRGTTGKDGDQQADNPPETERSPDMTSGNSSSKQAQPQAGKCSAAHLRVGDQHELASQPHAVASAITVFIDGTATKTGTDGRLLDLPKKLHGNKGGSGSKALQIVVAYKLLLIPDFKIDWKNFVISAKAANINHWLQEEQDTLWKGHEQADLCSVGLSMINIQETDMQMTGHDVSANAESGTQDTASSPTDSTIPVPTGHDCSDIKPQNLKLPSGIPRTSSPMNHLEYFAWRHLEHILSVCAVPLSTPGLIDKKGRCLSDHFLGPDAQDVPLIALTCGDMSGHRINTSASYFAFQFLVNVARRLKKCRKRTRYIDKLERRIKTTCCGHIRWLKWLRTTNLPKGFGDRKLRDNENVEKVNFLQTGCFAANYWVIGEIMPKGSHTWQPPDTMTDTALQILKLAEFMNLYPEAFEVEVARQVANDIYIPWLVELDRLDVRKAYAWPHALDEGISKFRLDDHFWIWKALRFLDATATKVPRQRRLRTDRENSATAENLKSEHPWLERLVGEDIFEACKRFTAIEQRFSPSNVQRGILQRFTIENDVSKRRMLAVTRSARETRFLLHARDTALFYGEDCGFFPQGSSFQQLWENTIETQRDHEENQELVWENALQYALGIVMGIRRHTLNKANAYELVKECVVILIASGGHDAFFAGELEEGGREPTIFYDEEYRDFFYHAGFEINYVLLTNARNIHKFFQLADSSQPSKSHCGPSEPANQSIPPNEAAEQRFNILPGTAVTDQRTFKRSRDSKMKKSLPFTNVIYASNINAIEEEWLYNYPEFLSGSKTDAEDVVSLLNSEEFSSESTGKIIGDTILHFQSLKEGSKIDRICWSRSDNSDSEWENFTPFRVIDRKKQKRLGLRRQRQEQSETTSNFTDNKSLFEYLGASRTAISAKKRFIWLPCADYQTAFACWAASPDRERHSMSLFFDRHARYENNVRDETSIVFNEWQTELHLSFYVLVDKSARNRNGLPAEASKPFPGRPEKLLQRASISFRFDGDFFDRHWTCHLVEHMPSTGNETEEDSPFQPSRKEGSEVKRDNPGQLHKAQWQRKVLELYLLNRTLDKIDHASGSFLKKVKSDLNIDQNSLSFTILDTRKGSVSIKHWQQFEKVLQSMEEDLASALSTVHKWNGREEARGEEKPRWTRNDEKKYRTAIKKSRNTTEKTVGVLEARRDHIRRLKEALAASQTRFRDDLEFHQNENVRYFTYATVIFLPLGFAASFYSMSGVPDYTIVISLAQFAAAAFAVTIGILLSARFAFKFAQKNVRPGIFQIAGNIAGIVQRTRGGVAIDFFLEPSARRVLFAVSALKKDKRAPRAILDVLLGVLFTPIFGATWLAKALLVNVFDLLQACHIDTKSWRPVFSSDSPAEPMPLTEAQNRLRHLVEIPRPLRPFS